MTPFQKKTQKPIMKVTLQSQSPPFKQSFEDDDDDSDPKDIKGTSAKHSRKD